MRLKFQDPPQRTNYFRRTKLSDENQAIIDALKERPGEWALIKEDAYVNTSTVWKKRPGIEAKASTIGKEKNKCDVYARWVGEAS